MAVKRPGSRPLAFLLPLLVLFFVVGQTLPLYTDWLWFWEVGYPQVFSTILGVRGGLFLVFALLSFGLLYGNLRVASRAAAPDVLWELEDQSGLPSRLVIEPIFRRVVGPALLVVGLLAGLNAASRWEQWIRFSRATPFGLTDPIFGNDIGFYVFRLPFVSFVLNFLFFILFLTLLLTALVYFLYRGIVLTARGPAFSAGSQSHLLILVTSLLLLQAGSFYLSAYDILYSPSGVVFGAGFSDISASLPALRVLAVLCVAVAAVTAVQIFRRRWRPILAGLALLAVVWVVGLGIYPSLLQRFRVVPNEIVAERPFITNAIRMTRQAYGLDGIEERDFPADENLRGEDLARNAATITNIRLWDHRPLLATYSQVQEIRTYYKFVDVDNDRYLINGELRQVMLSPRELSYRNLPGGRSWINDHMVYTHGYGVVLGPVNRISPEGLPEFWIKDIPPVSTGSIVVTRPEIYYGEIGNDYVLVKTKRPELDYPSGADNVYTNYQGKGGVPVGSLLRRLLFALRFGTVNIPLNADITPESRIMYYRLVQERVRTLAPFLRLDPDAYLVITQDGRLVWIVDAYTTTDRYPYSEPTRNLGNYIRNSVKATVDAYDGTVNLYLADPSDPIIQVYQKAFPGILKPLSAMPADLLAHIRYPQELFRIQARKYSLFHMRDPQVFYNKEDLWSIPKKSANGREAEIEPYYTIMRLLGERKEEFVLLLPYTPTRKDNMSAWLAARSDVPNYGKLLVYNFPKQKLVFGPRQIEARIDQDSYISQQLSLWGQRGSVVIRGSLLAIPIERSLIYVEPLYLAAERGQLPELKRVIVAYASQIAMEESLELSLKQIFGEKARQPIVARAPETAAPGGGRSAVVLASQALQHYTRAQEYLRRGEWAAYGEELKRLEQTLREFRDRFGR